MNFENLRLQIGENKNANGYIFNKPLKNLKKLKDIIDHRGTDVEISSEISNKIVKAPFFIFGKKPLENDQFRIIFYMPVLDPNYYFSTVLSEGDISSISEATLKDWADALYSK